MSTYESAGDIIQPPTVEYITFILLRLRSFVRSVSGFLSFSSGRFYMPSCCFSFSFLRCLISFTFNSILFPLIKGSVLSITEHLSSSPTPIYQCAQGDSII